MFKNIQNSIIETYCDICGKRIEGLNGISIKLSEYGEITDHYRHSCNKCFKDAKISDFLNLNLVRFGLNE